MSHIANIIHAEMRRDANQGAYTIEIPEDTIYTDSYLKKLGEEKQREEINSEDFNDEIF